MATMNIQRWKSNLYKMIQSSRQAGLSTGRTKQTVAYYFSMPLGSLPSLGYKLVTNISN
jgi:hypothetical protein